MGSGWPRAGKCDTVVRMSSIAQQTGTVVLCPGQGAQAVGMGRTWHEQSAAARAVFDEADAALAEELGGRLSDLCFNGPAEKLNRTDVSQPAIYCCSVASYRGLLERDGEFNLAATAGLSLGEYTALHVAGVISFIDGLRIVAQRGKLMQEAAEQSDGSMVALIGAEEPQAEEICRQARESEVLVCANFNAPGQIVLSGHRSACDRAVEAASAMGLRATPLTVAGAFHSPLMQPAAERMVDVLATVKFSPPNCLVWSNVTAEPHDPENMELLRHLLIQQIVSPVKWAQSCAAVASDSRCGYECQYHELSPGSVLRGLMRRIDRNVKVQNHDEP
jgi:[acyl-carrier-protein] S-malonyltransferase